MNVCRCCGREIEWIRMQSGKSMPVDPEPVYITEGGKDVFVLDEGMTVTGQVSEEDTGVVGFVPHWATCKAAGSFRRQ